MNDLPGNSSTTPEAQLLLSKPQNGWIVIFYIFTKTAGLHLFNLLHPLRSNVLGMTELNLKTSLLVFRGPAPYPLPHQSGPYSFRVIDWWHEF